MINLTKVYGKVNTIKRNLFYGSDVTLKFYRGNTLVLELTDNWFLKTHPDSNLALGPEDIELKVADVSGLLKSTINKAIDRVVVKGVSYEIKQYEVSKTETAVWRFLLVVLKGATSG